MDKYVITTPNNESTKVLTTNPTENISYVGIPVAFAQPMYDLQSVDTNMT